MDISKKLNHLKGLIIKRHSNTAGKGTSGGAGTNHSRASLQLNITLLTIPGPPMPQVVVLTTLLFSLAYLASTNLALQNLRVETHWKTLLPQAVNGERLWIMTSLYLAPDDQERLRSEIINVIAFVADMSLEKSQVRFVPLNQLQSHAEGQDDPEMRAQVVVMAFNAAGSQQEGYKILDEAALTEICKPDIVSWSSSSKVTHQRRPTVLAVRVTD